MICSVSIRANQDVFVDFGSGMGRTLLMAGMYPFRSIVGVEISPDLAAIARQNVALASAKLRCTNITVMTCDAATAPVPSDGTVFFFFNPFSGNTCQRLLQSISDSLRHHPRRVTMICYYPKWHPRKERLDEQIARQPYMQKVKDVALSEEHMAASIYENSMWRNC